MTPKDIIITDSGLYVACCQGKK